MPETITKSGFLHAGSSTGRFHQEQKSTLLPDIMTCLKNVTGINGCQKRKSEFYLRKGAELRALVYRGEEFTYPPVIKFDKKTTYSALLFFLSTINSKLITGYKSQPDIRFPSQKNYPGHSVLMLAENRLTPEEACYHSGVLHCRQNNPGSAMAAQPTVELYTFRNRRAAKDGSGLQKNNSPLAGILCLEALQQSLETVPENLKQSVSFIFDSLLMMFYNANIRLGIKRRLSHIVAVSCKSAAVQQELLIEKKALALLWETICHVKAKIKKKYRRQHVFRSINYWIEVIDHLLLIYARTMMMTCSFPGPLAVANIPYRSVIPVDDTVSHKREEHYQKKSRRKEIVIDKRRISGDVQFNEEEGDIVEIVKLFEKQCATDRENIDFSSTLRIISKVLKAPLLKLTEESMILYNFEILKKGCVDNEKTLEVVESLESVVSGILTLLPKVSTLKSIISLTSMVFNMLADAIDDKDLTVKSSDEIENLARDILKDVVSSARLGEFRLKTPEFTSITLVEMVEKIRIKKNKINIQTDVAGKDIQVSSHYNHFIEDATGFLIFYNFDKKNWFVEINDNFGRMVKEDADKLYSVFYNADLLLLRNGSPKYYNDGVVNLYDNAFYVVIGNKIRYTEEYKINNGIYRYLSSKTPFPQKDAELFPIIYINGTWRFEEETSPGVTRELLLLLDADNQLKQRLMSKDITHSSVTPFDNVYLTQFDAHNWEYLKADNVYYRLNFNLGSFFYLQGEQNVFQLEKRGYIYHLKKNKEERVYGAYKEELLPLGAVAFDKAVYLDSSIVSIIKNMAYFPLSKFNTESATVSRLAGSVRLNWYNFIRFGNRLFKITDHSDGTLLISGADQSQPGVIVYKNIRSNTYFLYDKHYSLEQTKLIKKNSFSEDENASGLNSNYYETLALNSILRTHLDSSVSIYHSNVSLKPYGNGLLNFYRFVEREEIIIYHFEQDIYFYVVESSSDQGMPAPAWFRIYGTTNGWQMDLNHSLCDISILYHPGNMNVVLSLQQEALRILFNDTLVDHFSQLELNNRPSVPITPYDLSLLSERLLKNNLKFDATGLFSFCGKKTLISVNETDSLISEKFKNEKDDENELREFSIETLNRYQLFPHVSKLFNYAYLKLHLILLKAQTAIFKPDFDEYLRYKLKITNSDAQDIFTQSLIQIIERMQTFFNPKDKSNIIIYLRNNFKSEKATGWDCAVPKPQNISLADGAVLGFVFLQDPLDRIFINGDIFPLCFDATKQTEVVDISSYENIIIDIMNRQALQIVNGSPDIDRMYTVYNGRRLDESIEFFINQIGSDILSEYYRNEVVITQLNNYFTTNLFYTKYSLSSLLQQKNLAEIFTHDDYVKSLFILYNQDALNAIIRDLALSEEQAAVIIPTADENATEFSHSDIN